MHRFIPDTAVTCALVACVAAFLSGFMLGGVTTIRFPGALVPLLTSSVVGAVSTAA